MSASSWSGSQELAQVGAERVRVQGCGLCGAPAQPFLEAESSSRAQAISPGNRTAYFPRPLMSQLPCSVSARALPPVTWSFPPMAWENTWPSTRRLELVCHKGQGNSDDRRGLPHLGKWLSCFSSVPNLSFSARSGNSSFGAACFRVKPYS